jgi:DNA-binding NtrC family response regulator
VKGAFTGANQDRIGRFEQANGGTLLLDEIAEMPLPAQAKLLRVLQEREFVRLGANKAIPFTARVIAATHKDLSAMVQAGSFREDLFFRLFGITIELPPLRERGKDIVMLARKFAEDYAGDQGIPYKGVDKSAVEKLLQYHYPGNVRELKSIVELAVTMMDSDHIQAHDIIFPQISLDQQLLRSRKTMREYKLMILDHYLKKCNGDAREVSDILQIGKSTVYRMIKELESSQNGKDSQNDQSS